MRLSEANFFGKKHTIVEWIAQTMDDCKISHQNKYPLKNGWLLLFLWQKQIAYFKG